MIFDSGFQIEVLEGADRGKKIPLKSKELTLGRKLIPNERITHWILFNEPTVSRIHAVLMWNDEEKIYNIHHKSKTNPTLVNTLPVDRREIIQGDTIQMGLLVFKVTHESASLDNPVETDKVDFSFLLEKDERPVDGGLYYLEVTEGEDHGKTFPLIASRHVLGRLQGAEDAKEHEILLNEHYIPEEHIFLNWNSREGKYGAIKSEHSPLISQVRRATDTMETSTDITSQRQVLLEEGDELLIGTTVLLVRRDGENVIAREESASSSMMSAMEGEESPAEPLSDEAETEAPQAPAYALEEEAQPSQQIEAEPVPQADENPLQPAVESSPPKIAVKPLPMAADITMQPDDEPVQLPIVMEELMKLKSIPLDVTEKPRIIPMAVGEPEKQTPPYVVSMEEIDAAFEQIKSLIEPDYELSILAGPDRGNHVTFLRKDLREGKGIRIGRRQCIFNDIQLQDEQIGEFQATLIFRRGSFHIVNDNRDTPLYLNGDPVSSKDETELSSGDTITCGNTVMVLRDRSVTFRPGECSLEVVEGDEPDRGKVFDIIRETVTVGRAAHCDVMLSDPDIKPIHAAISRQNASFIVQLLSEDGVLYLNGVSILIESPRELHQGDLLRLSTRSSLVFSRKQR
jgi:pSer/pThr/pTyr-binding forkhead associated (FHA) protein